MLWSAVWAPLSGCSNMRTNGPSITVIDDDEPAFAKARHAH